MISCDFTRCRMNHWSRKVDECERKRQRKMSNNLIPRQCEKDLHKQKNFFCDRSSRLSVDVRGEKHHHVVICCLFAHTLFFCAVRCLSLAVIVIIIHSVLGWIAMTICIFYIDIYGWIICNIIVVCRCTVRKWASHNAPVTHAIRFRIVSISFSLQNCATNFGVRSLSFTLIDSIESYRICAHTHWASLWMVVCIAHEC